MIVETQLRLLDREEFEHNPAIDFLRELLRSLPDGELLRRLDEDRGQGRDEYPVRVCWGVMVLRTALRLRHMSSMLEELQRNGDLRRLIGIEAVNRVPPDYVMSKFVTKLGGEAYLGLMREIFDTLIKNLGERLPDLGVNTAGDSTNLSARRSQQAEQAVSEAKAAAEAAAKVGEAADKAVAEAEAAVKAKAAGIAAGGAAATLHLSAASVNEDALVNIGPSDIGPIKISPVHIDLADISPADISPVDISPVDICPVDICPVDICPVNEGRVSPAHDAAALSTCDITAAVNDNAAPVSVEERAAVRVIAGAAAGDQQEASAASAPQSPELLTPLAVPAAAPPAAVPAAAASAKAPGKAKQAAAAFAMPLEKGLPIATGGKKEYKDDDGKVIKTVEWFGYKLHLLVCATYEVILGFAITSTKLADPDLIPEIVRQAKANLPEGRIRTLAYDKAADTAETHEFLNAEEIKPVIQARHLWQNQTEKLVPGYETDGNIVYEEDGTVFCVDTQSDPSIRQPMAFVGYEPDRGTIKYRCPAMQGGFPCAMSNICNAGKEHGKIVRIKVDEEPRRFPPLPRNTLKFERLYNGRTTVERVNARIKSQWGEDDGNVTGAPRFHSRAAVLMVVHAAFATLLAKNLDATKAGGPAQAAAPAKPSDQVKTGAESPSKATAKDDGPKSLSKTRLSSVLEAREKALAAAKAASAGA